MDVLLSSVPRIAHAVLYPRGAAAAPSKAAQWPIALANLRKGPLSSPCPALRPCNGPALQRITGSWCSPHRRAACVTFAPPNAKSISLEAKIPAITFGPEGGGCCHNAAFPEAFHLHLRRLRQRGSAAVSPARSCVGHRRPPRGHAARRRRHLCRPHRSPGPKPVTTRPALRGHGTQRADSAALRSRVSTSSGRSSSALASSRGYAKYRPLVHRFGNDRRGGRSPRRHGPAGCRAHPARSRRPACRRSGRGPRAAARRAVAMQLRSAVRPWCHRPLPASRGRRKRASVIDFIAPLRRPSRRRPRPRRFGIRRVERARDDGWLGGRCGRCRGSDCCPSQGMVSLLQAGPADEDRRWCSWRITVYVTQARATIARG